jgi:predicted nucleic acid-binding protein
MAILEVVIADFDLVVAAIQLHKKHLLSFWDSLVLQAAKQAGCSKCLSEDLQDGLRVDGLTVLNPFRTQA